VTVASTRQPLVVGVAGGSGSGKSTVVRALVRRLGGDTAVVIPHDAYYKDLSHLSAADRALANFDHPDSLETDLLLADLERLLEGDAVRLPRYDFATHTRSASTREVKPASVLILEGVLVLADARLRSLMDLKVFVDTAADVRLARRLRRDLSERGRSAASILDQYEATVRPMHEEFVEPSKRHADILVTEGGHNQEAIGAVIARVGELLVGRSDT